MSTEENKDGRKIKVTIDNEQTKILAEELARERIKNDKLVDKIASKEVNEDKNDLATLKIQAIQKFGRPDLFLDADSKESLSARITNYINEIASKGKGENSGSAPANEAQYGIRPQDLYTKRYEDFPSMIRDLREKAKTSKEAESYLTSLWEKHRELKMQDIHRPEPSYNPNSPEALEELGLVQKDGFLTPANKEDGDIGQLQRKWRLERKRRMENQQ